MRTTPVPPQVRQAPWLLKASSSARGRKTPPRTPGTSTAAPPPPPGWAAHSARWGSGWLASREYIRRRELSSSVPVPKVLRMPGTLAAVEGQGGGDVAHIIHIRPGRLGHPSSGVGGQGLQVPPGTPRRTAPPEPGRISPSRIPGHPHDLVERHVHINVFQVMYPRAPDLDVPGRVCVLSHMNVLPSRPPPSRTGGTFPKITP